MIKYIAGFKLTQLLVSFLGSMYVLFVYKTSTINLKNRKNIESLFKKNESFIYAFWHDQLLMCPLTWQSELEIKVLTSATIRCYPINNEETKQSINDKKDGKFAIFSKAY